MGHLFPGIYGRASIIYPQNGKRIIPSLNEKPILMTWRHYFSSVGALYLRHGFPTDKTEKCKWGKGGGMGKCLQAFE